MKCAIVTDLHFSKGRPKYPRLFTKFLRANKEIDALIISGDLVSVNVAEASLLFESIRNFSTTLKVFVVRGNHDFWDYDRKFRNLKHLDQAYRDLMDQYDIHYLQNNHYEDDEIQILGFDGWYSDSNPPTNDYAQMPRDSGEGSITPFQYLVKKELEAVEYILDNINPTKKTIVVTHFNPFSTNDPNGQYDTMSGSRNAFNAIVSAGVDFFIFGHTHQRYEEVRNDGLKRYTLFNAGASYWSLPGNSNNFYKIIDF